ncbi:MAG: methyltransferase domain-containing protein [Bacteroidetes bacterium]|nr:methyltransferase domain-containing protein [Bacteroidota bacterium]
MADKKWFETWFDTPYYHLLYSHRNDEEARTFVSNLVGHLQIPQGSRVLDVACGKGRHSRYLAKLGYETTGLDLSPHSIEEARKEMLPNLHFEVWDMRKVYRVNYFSLVVNLFSSFGYFDNEADDQAAIRAMADDLMPGGTLVLDYMNPECISKLMKPRDIINRGDIQFHLQKKLENGFIIKDINFIAEGAEHHYQEKLKMIKPEQFRKLFEGAGLTITEVFGSYDLVPFKAGESNRQVIVAKKK